MRLHEITNTPGEYPTTDAQVEELLQGSRRHSAQRRRMLTSSAGGVADGTRGARPAARPLPDLLPDLKLAIL
jgi:hypothetical protein